MHAARLRASWPHEATSLACHEAASLVHWPLFGSLHYFLVLQGVIIEPQGELAKDDEARAVNEEQLVNDMLRSNQKNFLLNNMKDLLMIARLE